MDDEKLILLVQANECLYNKYSPGYKLNRKTEKCLETNFQGDADSR